MQLVARQLLCAVDEPFRFAETVVTLACGSSNFTAKGRTVLSPSWRAFTQREETEKPLAAALLRDGRVRLDRIRSDKTGKTYAATLTLTDDGEKASYGIVFGK